MTETPYSEEMIRTRRRLHQHPEEGWSEFETTWLVVSRLKQLGYAVLTGHDVIATEAIFGRNPSIVQAGLQRALAAGVPQSFLDQIDGLTGAVAVLDTGRPGPVTALRFDMDCVKVQELEQKGHPPFDEGFNSQYPGLMHACGHDAHTAVGLAVAHWLKDHAEQLCGRIKLVFQPAEEGVRGAAAMCAAGVVDDVDWFLGGHIGTVCKLGEAGVCVDGFLATTKFDVWFKGRASHAGEAPEQGRSALLAACSAALLMNGITRHSAGTTRISVGRVVAGEARNVTPVNARMEVEVRGATHELNQYMFERAERIVEGTKEAFDVQGGMDIMGSATTLMIDTELTEQVAAIEKELVGEHNVKYVDRDCGSEDCTWLIKRVAERGGKGAFFLFGANHHGHHCSDFDVQDRQSLGLGFDVFTRFVLLKNGSR